MTHPDADFTRTAAEIEVWWISDGPVNEGGKKILGPFESRELALEVRALYEDHPRAKGLTFWVSRDSAAERQIAAERKP